MATVSSRSRFFSWGSKNTRQTPSTQEPYHRIGGLLPIDASNGNHDHHLLVHEDAKDTTWCRNPKNLSIVPPDYITSQSPDSGYQNEAQVKSTPNLLAVFSDIFPTPTAYIKTPDSALLTPFSKYSRPTSPALPAELPGSLLLEHQGFPVTPPPADAESTPNSAVLSVRSMYSFSSATIKSNSSTKVPQHKKSAHDLSSQKRSKSRASLIASPSSAHSKTTICSNTSDDNTSSANSTKARVGPETHFEVIVEEEQWKNKKDGTSKGTGELASKKQSPIARRKQLDELKATITAQDQTISTLQSQFANLRVSHDAHVSSLVNAHSLELAALKDYAKSLESQQRGLHHASSNHLLFMIDTTDPQSPKRDDPLSPAGSTPANSVRSFKKSSESPRSPLRSRNHPEMESLKKKLSMTKRPETGNGDAVRELNMYKKNNEALQKQIESLMTKLNQSEEDGRKQKRTLEDIQKTCDEWQEKASKAEEVEKNSMALQNTINHLEYRLEIANNDKVDAEDLLLQLRLQKTPFDSKLSKLQVPDNRQSTRTSMSTVFANESPISANEQEPTTLAAFVSHIDRLQEQVRQKDTRISEVEAEYVEMRKNYDRLQSQHKELDLQTGIQSQLLAKAKQHEIHIEELRTAMIKRETIIGEKSKALQQTERQLQHHKLLLEAEIRRHAAFSLLTDSNGKSLPELTSLASKDDIDRWIERLQKQLSKDKTERECGGAADESAMEALRRENDFYIREIIYYKLDCRGYKSDIKKLKRIAAQMGGHDNRSGEPESDSSVCKSAETAEPAKLLSAPSALEASTSPSSVSTRPISLTIPLTKRMTLPPSELTPAPSPVGEVKQIVKPIPEPLEFNMPMTPCTPPLKAANLANEVDNIDPGISPRSVARLSAERRKPTPSSPDQEKFGELATNFPLSTPAAPKRYGRSMSDSVIQFWSQVSAANSSSKVEVGVIPIGTRERSGSVPEPLKGKTTPERPARPRVGLFDANDIYVAPLRLQTAPQVDVMAEAMRNSPDQTQKTRQTVQHKHLKPSAFGDTISSTAEHAQRSKSSPIQSAIPAPLQIRSREGSASSATLNPSRKPSTTSSSDIPFVIAMGSPHNPALIIPTASIPPKTCSITGKTSILSPTLRTGVGGTMASTTPVTSPVSASDLSKHSYFNSVLPSSRLHDTNATKSTSALPIRSASISSSFAAPTAASRSRTMTSGPSRSLSASSIRHKIDFIKGKGKARKDSIRHPAPLASPFFDGNRSTHDVWQRGIGKAI